jgi:PAS domain S-box-containing protein
MGRAGIIGSVERRRNHKAGQSPMAVLREMPALVVLERFPVPTLAIAEDGSILFANSAFAEMLGYSAEEVLSLKFDQIFHAMPADESALSLVRRHADLVVELVHQDGSIRRARMSKSAMIRDGDPVALAAFQDLTEKLWSEEV